MDPERWEHGSEYHWLSPPPAPPAPSPWDERGAYFGSGRDALRALLTHGVRSRGWKRVLLPSYLCQEVVGAIARDGVHVESFPDRPGAEISALPEASRGDVVLLVNTLGLRTAPSLALPEGVDVIEDHTHDPWSPWAHASTADYAVVALRKTLPVPDGGIVWSPPRHALPSEPPLTTERELASARKLAAMVLKARYLDGADLDKEAFRALALRGEEQIASGDPSGITALSRALLRTFPLEAWRRARRDGFEQLAKRLAELRRGRVLEPAQAACAFSITIVFETAELREHVRRALIEARIYPAVLWPLEEALVSVSGDDLQLSRTMLSIHCDARYSRDDLDRVADTLLAAETSAP